MTHRKLQDCRLGISEESFCIHAPSFEAARQLKDNSLQWLALQALALGVKDTKVYFSEVDKPYQIPATFAAGEYIRMQEPPNQKPLNQELSEVARNLVGASYLKILEFLQEQRKNGNIVIITSNITRDDRGNIISTNNPAAGRDLCHHTSDLLRPSRAFWSASQFSGYNYRLSWRQGFDDYDNLNPQYHHLKQILERDGTAPNYEYTLYRPDGALCSYSTSYFLCDDYCGDSVRIGVSRPQDWQLIQAAPQEARV